jgi:NADH-quinone oxidoreductase subunit C
MTEIPEHLMARAAAAREKAAAKAAAAAPADDAPAAAAKADPAEEAVPETDEQAEAALATLQAALGDKIVASHIAPGRGLWIRVGVDDWRAAATAARDSLDCRFFDWLSAIDWMPSPYGRELGSEQDGDEAKEPEAMAWGYTGGATRFQLICRVHSITRHFGVMIKADLPDAEPRALSLVPVYPGANWHEREAWEMFGIVFDEHPDVRHIYLPGDFEGHPLRKDYPLLSRRIKPWPGIVDVEAMPGE